MNEAFQMDLQKLAFHNQLIKPQSWLKQIEFINHLILFNNLIICVLAEQQGGKTSFGQLLQEGLDSQIKICSMTMQLSMATNDLIEALSQNFHLRNNEHTDISSLIRQINERRKHVLLLIDEAQHLPETFIKEVLLALKNQEEQNYFHVCLLSDYSIAANINELNNSFFANRVHKLELEVFDEEESRMFFAKQCEKTLTQAQWQKFYQLTRGNLSLMNHQKAAFLIKDTKKTSAKASILKPLIFSLMSVVISLGVGGMLSKPAALVTQEEPAASLESHIASWQDNTIKELLVRAIAKQQDLDVATQKDEEESFKSSSKPYTIQLVASPDKRDMARFQKKNQKFQQNLQLSQYQEKEGTWYVLTLGEFESVADALQKIEELPPELMKLNPWVRPVASLATV